MSAAVVIDRSFIKYDDPSHAYWIDDEPVPGISSVAKIGADSFSPGAWWGWKLALEGVLAQNGRLPAKLDQLVAKMKGTEWTPNKKRDAGGVRGTAVHDALERLAQEDVVPDPDDYPAEERGHVLSLVRWYLRYRPQFVATEVMVGSRKHMFAGRYDIRAILPGIGLCLIDLKTSKATYPESHFPQLEGYELASVEMGFPPTDGGRWLLRTSADGSFVAHDERPAHKWDETNMVKSWATGETFLGYLAAYKEREAQEDRDPAAVWRAAVESWLMVCVSPTEDDPDPKLSRELATLPAAERFSVDSRAIGRLLGGLRKRGLVEQHETTKRWIAVDAL